MEMIEIDPKLFVTCRLCLDNLGVYQIVPTVQKLIKFCYDIEVHPFDGLPQLICKSCESVLSKYSEIKNNYVNKQKTLKTKLETKDVTPISAPEPEPEPQPEPENESKSEEDTVNSTQQLISDEKDNNEVIVCDASSYKSTDTETSAIKKVENKKPRTCRKRPLPDLWETDYDKWFTCRFCNKHCKTRCGMIRHINTHSSLIQKYRTYIDKGCLVKLTKTDNRPNLCNSEQIVVHNMDKFISSDDNFYYSVFKQKRMIDNDNDEVYSAIETMSVQNTDKSLESSDSEPVFPQNKRKRIRLISKSSNETVILENNDKNQSSNVVTNKTSQFNMIINGNECINLDDSSDSVSCKSVSNTNNNLNKNSLTSQNQIDCNIIQNIISVCYKKYVKRFEKKKSRDSIKNCTKNIDPSLKHKALSFGKKIIDSTGINYVGILNYLEFHNLDVVWIPRLLNHTNKKLDHVQISIKLKDPAGHDGRDSGWTLLKDLRNPVGSNTINLIEENCVENQTLNENIEAHSSICQPNNTDKSERKNDTVSSDQTTFLPIHPISDNDLLLKKLLNANPVQNPKQLRKKSNTQETQTGASFLKKPKEKEKPTLPVTTNETAAITANKAAAITANKAAAHLPIITSTISLAPVATETDNTNKQNKVNEEITKPNHNIDSNDSNINENKGSVNESQTPVKSTQWIKVKPVTELMSNRALDTMNKQNAQGNIAPVSQSMNLPYQNPSNIVSPNSASVSQPLNLVYVSQLPKPVEMSTNTMLAKQTTLHREYVLMDTVGLPSTRTDSPFRYFQTLLEINKIILLEGSETLPINFNSLIKFKLVFQQDGNMPVVLCLSLYFLKPPNSPARFCIKVRDMQHTEIDIANLSANWQWEILKVYGGDVVTKMLQNAQKISQTVYDCTKTFVSLLKEIRFQKLS